MSISITRIADAYAESPDYGKGLTRARDSSNSSNLCVGTRLRIRRTACGISPQQFSKQLGIDRDDLNAYETGTMRVSANLLLRVANLLDVRPDYFFRDYTEQELEDCLNLPPSITL